MAYIRPRYIPLPSQDAPESGRLILRDGTTAEIRSSQPKDKAGLKKFFSALSPELKRHRFFGTALPSDDLIEAFCDSSNPRTRLTLQLGPQMYRDRFFVSLHIHMNARRHSPPCPV
jgi:hypothetical protein